MISKYKYKGLLWVDLQSPRPEEAESIIEEFELPENLKDKICKPNNKSITNIEPHFTHSVLSFPKINTENTKFANQEIGFIIGKNFLITIHYEFVNVIDNFAKKFEAEELLEANVKLTNSASLFYYLIQILNDDTTNQVSKLQNRKKKSSDGGLVTFLLIVITILIVLGIIIYLK